MSVIRVGSTEKYADNWDNIFGGKKKSAGKKTAAKGSAKKLTKKTTKKATKKAKKTTRKKK